MSVLEARAITKDYPEGRGVLHALKGVSLTLERGEVVTLEGPSGSGKTTLLFILGCLLMPTSGHVVIEGRPVDPRRPDRLPKYRRDSIGFVFQHYNLFAALTAAENVEYALNVKGIRGRAARRESARLLEALGLAERRHARPRDLSGGQKQRVAIARALAGASPIILADEPTSSLDSQTSNRVLDEFRHLSKQEDRALLIVTHDARVRRIADRVAQLRDGCLCPNEIDPGQPR